MTKQERTELRARLQEGAVMNDTRLVNNNDDSYTVTDRVTGAHLGTVRKISRRLNLARPVTITYWITSSVDDDTHYSTRRAAVAALTMPRRAA